MDNSKENEVGAGASSVPKLACSSFQGQKDKAARLFAAIANDRMPDRLRMNAYLMRAAGVDDRFDERGVAVGSKRTKRRSRALPLNGRIDGTLLGYVTFKNREIRFPDLAVREHR